MDTTLIIDGNSIANRAFYALPYLSNHDGEPSGAVFGFANILIKIVSELKPDYIAVAFDHSRQTFRNQIFKSPITIINVHSCVNGICIFIEIFNFNIF